MRSLSRSLQRDALNLVTETDGREVAVLRKKYGKRLTEMTHQLANVGKAVTGARRDRYVKTQTVVLDRLAAVERLSRQADRNATLAAFRRQVRPNERAASGIADALIAEQEEIVAQALHRTRELERRELAIGASSALVLSLLAAIATFFIVLRTVVRPLSDIEQAMSRIAAGETEGRTPHEERQDEIGRMARSIEVFRASVRERETLQAETARARTETIRLELEHEQASRQLLARNAERTGRIARVRSSWNNRPRTN